MLCLLSQEPLAQREPAICLMQEVSTDLFSYGGKNYLTLADKYSGYLFAESLAQISTDHIGPYAEYNKKIVINVVPRKFIV